MNVVVVDKPFGINQSSIMLIPNGIAPQSIKTRRRPSFESVLSVNHPNRGSLIASQIFPIKSALPAKTGNIRAVSV